MVVVLCSEGVTAEFTSDTLVRMKWITVLPFGLALAGCLASAQELTKQVKIERILAATNADATMTQVFNQIKTMTASAVPAGTTPEQQVKSQEAQNKILDLVKSRMNWDKMRPQYMKIYDETFSDQEISGIFAFYQSPAGHAMVEKMPTLISKAMAVVQSQMADLMPEIQRITKEAAQGQD
jgi:uncharacterized protein